LPLPPDNARRAVYFDALLPGRSLRDRFALVAEAGFAGVELRDPEDEGLRDELRDAAAETGIAIHSVGPRGIWQKSLCSSTPSEAVHALRAVVHALHTAKHVGAETLLITTGHFDPSLARAEVLARLHKIVSDEILPAAQSLDIGLVIENTHNMPFADAPAYAQFIDAFNSPRVRALLDIGNVRSGLAAEWIDVLGPRIQKMHAKDFTVRRSDGKFTIRNVGEGVVDWPSVCRALERIGFNGWITSAEPRAHFVGRAVDRIARNRAWMDRARRVPQLGAAVHASQEALTRAFLKHTNLRSRQYLAWRAA